MAMVSSTKVLMAGDKEAAKQYEGFARLQLDALKNFMTYNNLPTGTRSVDLGNGNYIKVSSVYGLNIIEIHMPVSAPRIVPLRPPEPIILTIEDFAFAFTSPENVAYRCSWGNGDAYMPLVVAKEYPNINEFFLGTFEPGDAYWGKEKVANITGFEFGTPTTTTTHNISLASAIYSNYWHWHDPYLGGPPAAPAIAVTATWLITTTVEVKSNKRLDLMWSNGDVIKSIPIGTATEDVADYLTPLESVTVTVKKVVLHDSDVGEYVEGPWFDPGSYTPPVNPPIPGPPSPDTDGEFVGGTKTATYVAAYCSGFAFPKTGISSLPDNDYLNAGILLYYPPRYNAYPISSDDAKGVYYFTNKVTEIFSGSLISPNTFGPGAMHSKKYEFSVCENGTEISICSWNGVQTILSGSYYVGGPIESAVWTPDFATCSVDLNVTFLPIACAYSELPYFAGSIQYELFPSSYGISGMFFRQSKTYPAEYKYMMYDRTGRVREHTFPLVGTSSILVGDATVGTGLIYCMSEYEHILEV